MLVKGKGKMRRKADYQAMDHKTPQAADKFGPGGLPSFRMTAE